MKLPEIVRVSVADLKQDLLNLDVKNEAEIQFFNGPGKEIQLLSIYVSAGKLIFDVGEVQE